MTDTWSRYFLDLYQRTGGGAGNNSANFNYPASQGASGQILTSQGSGNASHWVDQITKLSQLSNADTGFITAAQLAGYAKVASPAFTGVPTAPTAAVNTYSKQIATTEFVINQESNTTPISGANPTPGTSTLVSRDDHIHPPYGIPNGSATNPGYIGFSTGIIVGFGSTVVTTDASGNATVSYGFTYPHGCFTFIPSNGNYGNSTSPVFGAGIFNTSSSPVHCPTAISVQYRVNWVSFGY